MTKCCPEYFSLVFEVSGFSYQKTLNSEIEFFLSIFLVVSNFSKEVLSQFKTSVFVAIRVLSAFLFEFLSLVAICAYAFWCYMRFVSIFDLKSPRKTRPFFLLDFWLEKLKVLVILGAKIAILTFFGDFWQFYWFL